MLIMHDRPGIANGGGHDGRGGGEWMGEGVQMADERTRTVHAVQAGTEK
jgi:hypothetical protein